MTDSVKIYIPYRVLNAARDNSQLKELSWFLVLKRLYSNGCIFNYNIHSLSKKSGKSYSFIKRNIKIFLDNGWCKMHNENLIFSKLIGKKKCFIQIESLTNKNVYYAIACTILQQKKNQCDFLISKRLDLLNPETLSKYKQANSYFNKKGNKAFGEIVREFKISVYSIAKLFHCSIGQASKIITALSDRKMIEVIHNIVTIAENVSNNYYRSIQEQLKQGSWFFKNCIYRTEPNTIVFIVSGISSFPKK